MKNKMINVLFAMLSVLLLIGCPQATNTSSENNSGTGGITRLSRPSITPVGGFYPEGALEISISSRENAPIFYTTDGSTPNERDKKYTGPFNITIEKGKDVEITARAIQGSVQSSVASEFYSDISSQITVENPIFSLSSIDGTAVSIDSSGEYSQDSLSVELSIPTEDAQIYYTINGGEPSQSDELYTTPINLDLTTNSYIIRAIGTKNKAKDSAIVEISVSKTGAPKAPVITTTIADYYDAATLARINPTLEIEEQTDVTFTYSTDGETYSDSVPSIGIPSDGGSVTVYVRATKGGFDFTPTSSATFIINTTPLASPTINASDFYNANGDKQNASVTITGEEGATIFYSASAANPSTEYSAPFALAFPSEDTKDFTVKAIARRIGETESAVTEETITFEKRVLEAPVIETDASDFNVGGSIQAEVPLNITMSDTNATVYFKIDSEPQKVYDASTKPMIPYKNGNTIITARAEREGYTSATAEPKTITLQGEVLSIKPVINIETAHFYDEDGDAVSVPIDISLSSADSSVQIWYSINGGVQMLYNAAKKPSLTMVERTSDIVLKAYARKVGFVDSIVDETFDIRTLSLSTTFTGSDHSQAVSITRETGITYEVSANNIDYVRQLIPSVKLIDALTYAQIAMDSQHSITLKVRASRDGYVSKTNTHNMTVPKEYYVKPGYNSNENGSSDATFENLQRAVDIITKINDGSSTYTINVTGDITKEGAVSAGVNKKDDGMVEIEADDNTKLKLKIVGLDSSASNINASTVFDANTGNVTTSGLGKRVMYINGDKVSVTLQNINLIGGSTTSGGGLYIESGELTLNEDAEISKNRAENGGGIYMQGGTVNLSGGDGLYNNLATESGGGVYLNLGNFNLSNGNIWRNKALGTGATVGGGGVYIGGTDQSPTSFVMTGGQITYNSAKSNGGGILHSSSSSTFRLDGDASISAGENTLHDGTTNSIELLVSSNGIDIGNITNDIYINAPIGATLAKNVTTADKSKINIQGRAAGSYTLSYFGGKIGLGNSTQRYRVENGKYYYLERSQRFDAYAKPPVYINLFSRTDVIEDNVYRNEYEDIHNARNGIKDNNMSFPNPQKTWVNNNDKDLKLYDFTTGTIQSNSYGDFSVYLIKSGSF